MSEKAKFGSKIGLITATVGSAVGLGNVWRFPAEVQENGGAAFLLIYIACVIILGIPVMLSEFALGRGGQSDAIGVFQKLTPGKKWYFTGLLGVVASYIILSFYMVVAGWTLEYFWQSIFGNLYDLKVTNGAYIFEMKEMISTSWNPIIWTCVMILLNLIVLLKGVNKGIEKVSNVLMPVLFLLLVMFCVVALNMPKASEGLEFLLKPDFDKVTGATIVNALGQAFFSLSLGMGVLITFSSYYPKNVRLTRTAFTVSALDFVVALLMGFIIFPAVKSFGLDSSPEALEGTTLVFVTLPEVFAQMPWSSFWSALFFLLLAIAALTSTVSLAEVNISLLQDKYKFSRVKSAFIVITPLFIFSSLCSLSLGPLNWVTIFGKNIFDFLDIASTNILLPVCAFFSCVYVGWILPKNFLKHELSNYGQFKSKAYPYVFFSVKYIAPILILVILFSAFIK